MESSVFLRSAMISRVKRGGWGYLMIQDSDYQETAQWKIPPAFPPFKSKNELK